MTEFTIARAKAAMHAERIAAGVCPICDPASLLNEITGGCTNPACLLADFALPLDRTGGGLV